MPSDSRCAVTFSRDAFRATPLVRLTMFPGGSLHTRQIRRNASEEVTSSPTPYRNVTTFPRQQRPKLFPDLHKGAVDGCLGRNAQLVDDEKKLPLCQYRFEQKKFLAIPADFGAIART